MSNNFPYDCFLTDKIFTLKDLEISPINVITSSLPAKISLFSDKKYADLISTFIKNHKLDDLVKNDNNTKMQNLSSNFFLKLDENKNKKDYLKEIYIFCKSFYDTKYLFIKEKKNYLRFSSLLRKLNSNKNLFTKNLRYENPNIYDKNLHSNIKLNELLSSHDNEERNAIDNVILGNTINFSLPSIGPIFSIYTHEKCDISSLIYKLITTDRPNYLTEHNYLNFIPLFKQKVYDTLSNMLTEKNDKNNLWNLKVGNTNNKTLKYIKQHLKNTNISLVDVFYDSNNILKKKYQVPYKIDPQNPNNIIYNISSTLSSLAEPSDQTEKKYWAIHGLISSNNSLIDHLLPLISIVDNLNKPNVKNALCSYVFFIINLFYDFYKAYIDKLNNIIINIPSSHIRKDLNFSIVFNYIERLNISLLNFKKILLNNFYELFLPSYTSNNNYGMILNKDGFYIPEGTLLANNEDIQKNFPFIANIISSNESKNIQPLISFMFLNEENKDIYDDNLSLDLGGFSYNKITTRKTMSILNKFYDKYKVKNLFNIYLLELLENFFKEKSCSDLIILLKDFLDNTKVANFSKHKSYFEEYYQKNLFSASIYMAEIIKLDKKIKKNNTDTNKTRDTYLLTSSILFFNSEICKYIIKYDENIDSSLKRELLEKFNLYNKKASSKILELQKTYKENKISNNNIIKPQNETLNSSFWQKFKSKISNKKLLIPIFIKNKSKIIFIDILDYALNGIYTDDLVFNIPKNIKQDYITNELMKNYIILFGQTLKDIKQNKFLAIKSEFIDKIKLLNDPQLVRKNIFKLITDIIFYNKYNVAISSSLEFYDLFKDFIKNKSNNFNRLIISHIQIKKISESI
jgi:hypothetical protein